MSEIQGKSTNNLTSNRSKKKFNGHIGRRVTILVIICILITGYCVGKIAISQSRGLAINLLSDHCTSTTNQLIRQLGDDPDLSADYTEMLDILKEDTGCELTIFEGDIRVSTTITKDGERAVGTPLDSKVADIVLTQMQPYTGEAEILGSPHICSYVPIIKDGKAIGLVFAGVSKTLVTKKLQLVTNNVIGFGLIFLFLSCLTVYLFIQYKVTKPMGKLTILAKEMESGNLGIQTGQIYKTEIHSTDEIGLLADTFESTFKQLSEYIKEISTYLGKLSEKDLRANVTLNYVGDFAGIRDSLENISTSLNNTMDQIHSASRDVSGGSNLVSEAAQSLSLGATQQASAIDQLSGSVEDISTHVAQNSITAQNAKEKAIVIDKFIQDTNAQMKQMVDAMEQITSASHEIAKMDKTIEDIAFQTNILSLNASVEAGRAGDAGKAFAAVANEVRNLAAKCSEASSSTDALIQHAIKVIQEGTEIVNATMQSTIHAADSIDEIVELVTNISDATTEQATSIEQFSAAIKDISTVVQTNSGTAEESASASVELSSKADALKEMVDSFTLRTSIY